MIIWYSLNRIENTMPTLSCDPAYSQLLDTNQELRDELQDEISINKSNERKFRSLVKELEQCYRTISLQDNTIIAHEKEIEKFKSEISNLRKQLRILQQDKKFRSEERRVGKECRSRWSP